MSPEETRETVTRLLSAFDEGGIEALAAHYADDYVNHTPFPGASNDLAGHAAFLTAAAPHLEFLGSETLDIVADAGKAAVLSKSRFRVRASGEEFEATAFSIVRLCDGEVIENWGGYDPIAVARMIEAGVVLPKAA